MSILRFLRAAVIVFGACLAATGCAVTRKSASVDSISRTPFLGLELAPKRRAPAPETQRISRSGGEAAEVESAKLVANGVPQPANWWQRLTGTEKRSSISLPRTDLSKTAAEKPEEFESVPLEPEFW